MIIFDSCEYEYEAAVLDRIIPNVMNIANSLNFQRHDKLIYSRYSYHYHYHIHTETIANVRIDVFHNSNVVLFRVYLFLNKIYRIISNDIFIEKIKLTFPLVY